MHQGEGVLQMRSHREERHGTGHRKRDRKRRVPSSPTEKDRQPFAHPNHRVVTRGRRFPGRGAGIRRRCFPTVARFGIGGGYRLFAAVPTGHHQWAAHLVEQQDMERCRGQHDPDGIQMGGHTRSKLAWESGAEQDHGPFAGEEETCLDGIDPRPARALHRATIPSPRRVSRGALTAAQLGHCRLAGRVRREMKSPHPAQAEDPTLEQHPGGPLERRP